MSAVIAKYSASRMAKPNPSSSNARTHDESHGRHCIDGNTRRVSQRYANDSSVSFLIQDPAASWIFIWPATDYFDPITHL